MSYKCFPVGHLPNYGLITLLGRTHPLTSEFMSYFIGVLPTIESLPTLNPDSLDLKYARDQLAGSVLSPWYLDARYLLFTIVSF